MFNLKVGVRIQSMVSSMVVGHKEEYTSIIKSLIRINNFSDILSLSSSTSS